MALSENYDLRTKFAFWLVSPMLLVGLVLMYALLFYSALWAVSLVVGYSPPYTEVSVQRGVFAVSLTLAVFTLIWAWRTFVVNRSQRHS